MDLPVGELSAILLVARPISRSEPDYSQRGAQGNYYDEVCLCLFKPDKSGGLISLAFKRSRDFVCMPDCYPKDYESRYVHGDIKFIKHREV